MDDLPCTRRRSLYKYAIVVMESRTGKRVGVRLLLPRNTNCRHVCSLCNRGCSSLQFSYPSSSSYCQSRYPFTSSDRKGRRLLIFVEVVNFTLFSRCSDNAHNLLQISYITETVGKAPGRCCWDSILEACHHRAALVAYLSLGWDLRNTNTNGD